MRRALYERLVADREFLGWISVGQSSNCFTMSADEKVSVITDRVTEYVFAEVEHRKEHGIWVEPYGVLEDWPSVLEEYCDHETDHQDCLTDETVADIERMYQDREATLHTELQDQNRHLKDEVKMLKQRLRGALRARARG